MWLVGCRSGRPSNFGPLRRVHGLVRYNESRGSSLNSCSYLPSVISFLLFPSRILEIFPCASSHLSSSLLTRTSFLICGCPRMVSAAWAIFWQGVPLLVHRESSGHGGSLPQFCSKFDDWVRVWSRFPPLSTVCSGLPVILSCDEFVPAPLL